MTPHLAGSFPHPGTWNQTPKPSTLRYLSHRQPGPAWAGSGGPARWAWGRVAAFCLQDLAAMRGGSDLGLRMQKRGPGPRWQLVFLEAGPILQASPAPGQLSLGGEGACPRSQGRETPGGGCVCGVCPLAPTCPPRPARLGLSRERPGRSLSHPPDTAVCPGHTGSTAASEPGTPVTTRGPEALRASCVPSAARREPTGTGPSAASGWPECEGRGGRRAAETPPGEQEAQPWTLGAAAPVTS